MFVKRGGKDWRGLPQQAGASFLELAALDPAHHGKTEPITPLPSSAVCAGDTDYDN